MTEAYPGVRGAHRMGVTECAVVQQGYETRRSWCDGERSDPPLQGGGGQEDT